jgi:hypothetical protein
VSDDVEELWTSSNIMLRFEREQGRLENSERYFRLALRAAYRLRSRNRVLDTLMVMALFEDDFGHDVQRDRYAELWDHLDTGERMETLESHFDWIDQPSSINLGMASEIAQSGSNIAWTVESVQEIRDIVLEVGVQISSAG